MPQEKWAKIALGWSLTQAVLTIVIEIIIYSINSSFVTDIKARGLGGLQFEANGKALMIYYVLFMAAQLTQFGLLYDAVNWVNLGD